MKNNKTKKAMQNAHMKKKINQKKLFKFACAQL